MSYNRVFIHDAEPDQKSYLQINARASFPFGESLPSSLGEKVLRIYGIGTVDIETQGRSDYSDLSILHYAKEYCEDNLRVSDVELLEAIIAYFKLWEPLDQIERLRGLIKGHLQDLEQANAELNKWLFRLNGFSMPLEFPPSDYWRKK